MRIPKFLILLVVANLNNINGVLAVNAHRPEIEEEELYRKWELAEIEELVKNLFGIVELATSKIGVAPSSPSSSLSQSLFERYQPNKLLNSIGPMLARSIWKYDDFEEFINEELLQVEAKLADARKIMDGVKMQTEDRQIISGICNVLSIKRAKLQRKIAQIKGQLGRRWTPSLWAWWGQSKEQLKEKMEIFRDQLDTLAQLEWTYDELYSLIENIDFGLKYALKLGKQRKIVPIKSSIHSIINGHKANILEKIAQSGGVLEGMLRREETNKSGNAGEIKEAFESVQSTLRKMGIVDGIDEKIAEKLAKGNQRERRTVLGQLPERKYNGAKEERTEMGLLVEMARILTAYFELIKKGEDKGEGGSGDLMEEEENSGKTGQTENVANQLPNEKLIPEKRQNWAQ